LLILQLDDPISSSDSAQRTLILTPMQNQLIAMEQVHKN